MMTTPSVLSGGSTSELSANRKLSGLDGGIRPVKSAVEPAQMKGRGIDLRDSNGHLLPHLAKGSGPAMKVFQPFRLDTVNHCLWRAEARVRLTPRAFDVLRYLVEHAERLVTQDEILEALWPETYVNPEVIKQYIRGIRKALGDDPEKPSYIETFSRRGYQFI